MEANLAILIDFENIATGAEKEGLGRLDVRLIMDRFKEKGRLLVARSYADWGRFSRFKQALLMENVSLFELTAHGMQDKNRADVALVVDCMELAFTKPYVDTFVLVSGDSDFTPLVLKLRELNKRVIGCGTRGSTSRLLVESCDEFEFYDTLARERARPEAPRRKPRPVAETELTHQEAFDLLTETLQGLLLDESEPVQASVLKGAMKRKAPVFSEYDLGFPTFTRFLETAQEEGLVCLVPDEKAGGVRVELPEAHAEEPEEEVHHFEGRTLELYRVLQEAGLEPLTLVWRRRICELLVAAMGERARRKRRATVQWATREVWDAVIDDDDPITERQVREVIRAMQRGGAFLHKDGQPVRSPAASCLLEADADGLLRIIHREYLLHLRGTGLDLEDCLGPLAELLLADRKKAREVAEAVAALPAPNANGVEAVEGVIPSDAHPEPEEQPSRRRRRSRGPGGEPAEEGTRAERVDEPVTVEEPARTHAPEPEEERRPARRRSRRADEQARSASASEPVVGKEPAVSAAAEPDREPAPRRRKPRRSTA